MGDSSMGLRRRYDRPARRAALLALAMALALLASTAGKSLAEPLQGAGNLTIYVTNVSDRGFTVSWTTNTAVTGEVRYGASKPPALPGADVGGPGPTTIHYFTISGLAASTTYYFDVQSGNTAGRQQGCILFGDDSAGVADATAAGSCFGLGIRIPGTQHDPDAERDCLPPGAALDRKLPASVHARRRCGPMVVRPAAAADRRRANLLPASAERDAVPHD